MKTYFADVWKVNVGYFEFLTKYWELYVVLIAIIVGLVSVLLIVYKKDVVDYLAEKVGKINDYLIRHKEKLENC